MNNIVNRAIKSFILCSVVLVSNVTRAELLDVSCVYETNAQPKSEHDHHAEKSKIQRWFYWRTDKSVEIANQAQSYGEKWMLGLHDAVFYQTLFHDKKFLLDFQPADLRILGKSENWNTRSTLIPIAILDKLLMLRKALKIRVYFQHDNYFTRSLYRLS